MEEHNSLSPRFNSLENVIAPSHSAGEMGTFASQMWLLTTLGLFLVIPTFHFINGVLYRRNSHPRQDGIGGDVNKEDAEFEYNFLCA